MPPLSTDGRETFEQRGWVRLRRAFAPELAQELLERTWRELESELGIARGDRRTWFQPARTLRGAKRDPLQAGIGTERLLGAIDALLAPAQWSAPRNWGIVLITFPAPGGAPWDVPTSGWHYDFDLHDDARGLAGLQVFTFLSAVEERGGGTVVVEGSHWLARDFYRALPAAERAAPHGALRRRFLRSAPWLRALCGSPAGPADRVAHFMGRQHEVRGVPLRVAELVGEPGDAILCHPLLLHRAAPNRREVPRFMRSQRILAKDGPTCQAPAMPDFSLFGDEHVRQYEASGGQVGHDWNGASCLVLHTVGRKSGETRKFPLIYGRDGDDWVIVASKGGAPQHPGWYLNLLANPEAKIQVRDQVIPVTAHTAGAADRARVWPIMIEQWPAYDDYQAKTKREIPVVLLRRR